jgi:MraZ protein
VTSPIFTGETTLKIDEKGRFNLPVDYRRKLGEQAVVTVGLDNQLEIWPVDAFNTLVGTLDEQSKTDESLFATVRWISRHAKEVGIDAQGRIALPLELRNAVGISGASQIVLLGLSRRIEVFAAAAQVPLEKPTKRW